MPGVGRIYVRPEYLENDTLVDRGGDAATRNCRPASRALPNAREATKWQTTNSIFSGPFTYSGAGCAHHNRGITVADAYFIDAVRTPRSIGKMDEEFDDRAA